MRSRIPFPFPVLSAAALAVALAIGPAEPVRAQATASGVSRSFFGGGDLGSRGLSGALSAAFGGSGGASTRPDGPDDFGRNHVPGDFGRTHVPGAFGGSGLLEPREGDGRTHGRRILGRPGAVSPFLLLEPAILGRRSVVAGAVLAERARAEAERARAEAERARAEAARAAAERAEVSAERARRAGDAAAGAADREGAPAGPSREARDVGRALRGDDARAAPPALERSRCALVRVRTRTGIGLRRRVDLDRIGAEDPDHAARVLRESLRGGAVLALPGPDGELTLPATLVDGLIVGPC